MKKTYILPIELKETIEREKDIFSSSTGIKLQEKQITAKDVVDIIEKNLKEIENNNIEISFEGEMFFPNNEFHFSLYAKTAKFTKTNQILSKEELDNILEHLKKEFILKNRVLDIIF